MNLTARLQITGELVHVVATDLGLVTCQTSSGLFYEGYRTVFAFNGEQHVSQYDRADAIDSAIGRYEHDLDILEEAGLIRESVRIGDEPPAPMPTNLASSLFDRVLADSGVLPI